LCIRQKKKKSELFLKTFGTNTMNELQVTGNKLTNNFMGHVTSGFGPDIAHRLPAGPHWDRELFVL
jgi:hypothetical protein